MPRFDKYDPINGGFRARLATNWLTGDVGVLIAVGIDANGRTLKGVGNTGFKGVVALGKARQAGDPIDVMTSGEIVDCTGLIAGTEYYIHPTTGVISSTAPATGVNGIYLGHTVEADRLIVRFQKMQG